MTTKTKETKQAYIKRARQIMEKVYKESLNAGSSKNSVAYKIGPYNLITLSFYDTCLWIKKNWSHTITKSTLRQYRASLKFMGDILLKRQDIEIEEYNKAINALDNIEGAEKKEIEPRTSANKQKSLKLKDLKKLGEALLASESKWGKLAYIWLYSGVFTGLRPIEWRNAQLIDNGDNVKIIVKNAKSTNSRSHGEKRTIYLNHLTDKQINVIKQHHKAASQLSEKDELWTQYYNGCSNLIRYHSRKIWKNRKKYPTLYSSRHQFSANLKASGCSKVEVATLMGHANDLTAQSHYGKKIHGTRGKKPLVDKNEMKNVRIVDKNFEFSFDKLNKKTNKNSNS